MSSSPKRLHPSVLITQGVRVEDRRTGLRLELGADAAAVLEKLQCGEALPADAEVEEFLGQLAALGLLDDGTAPAGAQGGFIREQAFESQRPSLLEALERAVQRTEFHRTRLHGLDLNVERAEDLQRLPPMFKQDLRQHLGALIASGVDVPQLLAQGDLAFGATSGSTGERLQVISDTRLATLPPSFEELWGLSPRWEPHLPRTAVFTSPVCTGPICHLGRSSMEERTVAGNTLFLNGTDDIFAISRELADNVFSELWRFRPDFLVVNPVYLCVLAERAQAWGLKFPPLSAIISTYQFLSRCQRRMLRRHFDCPVFDFLAATDLGGSKLVVECLHGSRHLRLDHTVSEVIRNGRSAAPGALGYFVLTTLNEVLPLVRYVLGDLARVEDGACRCIAGSSWPRVTLEGRAADMLWTGERFLTTRAVDDVIGAVRGVDFYQLRQLDAEGFELKIVPNAGVPSPVEEVRAVADALLGPGRVQVQVVSRLRAEGGQKFRFTVPSRPHRDVFNTDHPGLADDLFDRHPTGP